MKDVICPRCNSENIVKNGNTIYGRPEFICKDCLKQFVRNPVIREIPDEKKELIDKLFLEKTDHIERFNNVVRQGVSRLVRRTLSFPKKTENHTGSILFPVHHYNNMIIK